MNLLTRLSLAQMGKFFSHFGVRTLLILYLVTEVGYSDAHAFGVSAVFCSLVELGGVFGGIMADRYLGLRRATYLGGWILSVGYGCLLFEEGLFLAMGLIVVGGSLFASNITALLGLSYGKEDSKREAGFTIFYMMQNVGALIATLLCGAVALQYGFRFGFALAAVGMLLSNFILLASRKQLKHLGELPTCGSFLLMPILALLGVLALGTLCIWAESFVMPLLPVITTIVFIVILLQLAKDARWSKEQMRKFLLYLCAIIVFFAVEDQSCSSLILLSERETSRMILGFLVPSSWITVINPIVIILLGAFVSKIKTQLATPFILTGTVFAILTCFCALELPVSVLGIMGIVGAVSVAELLIGPLVFSYASEIASKGRSGLVMGLVPVAFSLAFQLSGWFSKMVAIEDHALSMHTYAIGFGFVTGVVACSAILFYVLTKPKRVYETQ